MSMRWMGLLVVGTMLGCSSESTPGPDPESDPDPKLCEAKVDECRINQQVCVVEAGAATCQACGVGEYAGSDNQCTPISDNPLSHDFPENTTAPGGEILGMCRSWTLNNETELWINAVELEQDEVSHHSNWMFVPEANFDGPDGIWPCADRNYSQLTAALAGGVLYAQSTQAEHEVQKFPNGAAYRIPPHARIISDIHTLNTTDEEVTGHAKLTIYAIEEAAVTVRLAPFHVTYEELTIPPMSTSRFSAECELHSVYGEGMPLDMQVYYMLPHTHALGVRMFVEAMGGDMDGETIIDVRGFNGEARGRNYDPPMDLAAADGVRFGCEFDNPRTEEVNWGFDDQEMCEALGFMASPKAFESRVSEANPGAMDGAIHTFSGACNTIGFAWDKN